MVEISSLCTNPSPTFDLATFLAGALRFKNDGHIVNKLAFPSTRNIPDLNTRSTSSSLNEGRKRRRGEVANPANTLDGLVARIANNALEPFEKRYLSEQEAIEGPDDELEAKRMENDPDVSTRTCSTCGYVGKWISEMIRHKRVHTNERPFKCRYCSRTSKWKADLIRHVAKTHGIRVVSKYSRSKTFHHSLTKLLNKDDGEKPKVFTCEQSRELQQRQQLHPLNIDTHNTEVNRPEPLLHGKAPLSYRCSHCCYEDTGHSVLVDHLRDVHKKYPYECRCRAVFSSIGSALSHATTSQDCSSNDLILNIIPTYGHINNMLITSPNESLSRSRSRNNCSPDSGVYVDVDDLELGRVSRTLRNISTNDSDNENASTGSLKSSLLNTPTSTAKALLSPLDASAALLAVQLPLSSDYYTTMAFLMNPSLFTPIIGSNVTHQCSYCAARFQNIAELILHVRFHLSANLNLEILNPHLCVPSNLSEQRDELVDVEK
ncbi:zinc finger, C2H2 type [Dictyocaulus viviparus]|uniref:Zinc finger, C2H2 type n=1 Tax=Dictyocaulus viviparus TaxID=29172 RepID=A0A0D8XW61_DICVI|nr:zinc finger, C2H2 type [Dictyocaulus viviparus]